MTNEEYIEFTKRLFVQYPSLWTWISSLDASKEVQALWRRKLTKYALDEALAVLEGWFEAGARPFEAYERDHVASVIASVIERERSKQARAEENERLIKMAQRPRRKTMENIGAFSSLRGDMRVAYETLRPIHKQMQDGVITNEEYQQRKDEVLSTL
jgi:hypothetical protein